MTMEELFKALPRDLQWEILEDFVGTHVVRKNKLMRSLTDDPIIQIMRNTYGLNPTRPPTGYLKNFVIHHRRYTFPHNYELENTRTEAKLEFSNKEKFVILFRNISTNKYSYGYKNSDQWIITPFDEFVVLPLYERHHYPSYPNTNKKLGRPVQTMNLMDPATFRFVHRFGFPITSEVVSSVLTSVLGLLLHYDLKWLFGLTELGLLGAIGIGIFAAVVGLWPYWDRMSMVLDRMNQDKVKGHWFHR
jgi:hypothetical protein